MARPSNSKSSLATWYARLVAFNVEDLFSRKRPPGPPRTLFVNEPLPQDYFDGKGKVKKNYVYTSNQVITSKYNIFTFLPRNLLEQFRRIANMFFLGIAVLQFFPKFSTISPGAVILPLIVVLTITALKDGYEDFKRHQSDNRVNNTKLQILSGGSWTNANASESKSVSFIRYLIPKRRKSILPASNSSKDKVASSAALPTLPHDTDLDFDYEDGDQKTTDKPHWKRACWEDVRVGDFVKIFDHEPLPADILICATSEEENVAFVETKNLDGETNLKSRHAVSALTELRNAQACADPANSFRIQCERPDTDMYRLNANVTVDGATSAVDLSTTLLRGTVLRNTGWVIGVVLFTGLDSKIVLNSGGTPSKRSKVERQMNPQVFVNLIILFSIAVICAIADSVLEKRLFPMNAPWLYDDNQSDDNPKINGVITWAFALLTFQDIVPISLYISIEGVRTVQAAFIYFDAEIWYEKTNTATEARSWNLSDDLGQIEYIFSDKTGTLTQNLMVFRMCSIGGKAYRGDRDDSQGNEGPKKSSSVDVEAVEVDIWGAQGRPSSSRSQLAQPTPRQNSVDGGDESEHFKDSVLLNDIQGSLNQQGGNSAQQPSNASALNHFFTVLSLCHTVLASRNPLTGNIDYKAQSPDESALVQAAADVGYIFLGKDKEILSVSTPRSREVEKYELLDILEFTSARKRMSVVLRPLNRNGEGYPNGDLLMLSKGADNVIFERLRAGEDELKTETESHLSEFANSGLRTLTLAYRTIPVDEYEAWSRRYQQATVALEDREQQVEAVSNQLEQNLELLGATAIEDRLQDGVPETIADLKKAGIKIWVATGDKLETAIAIGRSTNLISHDSNIVIIRGGSSRPVHTQIVNALDQFFPGQSVPQREEKPSMGDSTIPLRRINTGVSSIVGPENGDRPGGFILVVDGYALLEAFADEENKAILLKLAILCDGVICCRVSPLQKALVVRLVKDGLGAMTLAIGDGANDVSMIQAADVGIGISGEEGLQAVNSSDYSIAQFRFLKKLLLVHGHWSYARNGLMILNFFYKNIVPIGILFWFQIYNGWSGDYVFDYIYILFWNSLWTIAPVIGIGLFDRFLDSHVLMEVPELYRFGREGRWFGLRYFFVYMSHGIVQATVIFFLILYTYDATSSRADGYDISHYEFSTTMALAGVLVADVFTGFSATAWTWWLFCLVFVGIVVQWVFTAVYDVISPGYAVTFLFGNNYFLFHSAYFWLCLPITVFLALAPRYLSNAWAFGYAPGDLETFQLLQKKFPGKDFSAFSRPNQVPPPLGGAPKGRRSSMTSRRSSIADSVVTLEPRFPRPSCDIRSASRTDMATGVTSVDRGFDFATEVDGVAMRRTQTNLSERRMSKQNLNPVARSGSKGKDVISGVLSLPRAFSKRKAAPQPKESES